MSGSRKQGISSKSPNAIFLFDLVHMCMRYARPLNIAQRARASVRDRLPLPQDYVSHPLKLYILELQSMGRLLLLVLILATYIVEGKPWNLAIEVDFDNSTNIQVWQCNNSTGQKW